MTQMFGRAAPPAPTPVAPPPLPDPNGSDAQEARRKEIATAAGAGRSATILTTRGVGTIAGGSGAAPSYGAKTLGGS